MRKYDKIKVTTTSSLQNVEIQEYLEPISVSIVVGMNFFKDLSKKQKSYCRRHFKKTIKRIVCNSMFT